MKLCFLLFETTFGSLVLMSGYIIFYPVARGSFGHLCRFGLYTAHPMNNMKTEDAESHARLPFRGGGDPIHPFGFFRPSSYFYSVNDLMCSTASSEGSGSFTSSPTGQTNMHLPQGEHPLLFRIAEYSMHLCFAVIPSGYFDDGTAFSGHSF